MKEMNVEMMEELITNEEFNLQVSAAKNAQEVVELFAAKGVEIPMELAQELFEKPAADAELSADDLDDVAGGGWVCAAVGGTAAYLYYRSKGYSKAAALVMAAKHGYHGYTKLPW